MENALKIIDEAEDIARKDILGMFEFPSLVEWSSEVHNKAEKLYASLEKTEVLNKKHRTYITNNIDTPIRILDYIKDCDDLFILDPKFFDVRVRGTKINGKGSTWGGLTGSITPIENDFKRTITEKIYDLNIKNEKLPSMKHLLNTRKRETLEFYKDCMSDSGCIVKWRNDSDGSVEYRTRGSGFATPSEKKKFISEITPPPQLMNNRIVEIMEETPDDVDETSESVGRKRSGGEDTPKPESAEFEKFIETMIHKQEIFDSFKDLTPIQRNRVDRGLSQQHYVSIDLLETQGDVVAKNDKVLSSYIVGEVVGDQSLEEFISLEAKDETSSWVFAGLVVSMAGLVAWIFKAVILPALSKVTPSEQTISVMIDTTSEAFAKLFQQLDFSNLPKTALSLIPVFLGAAWRRNKQTTRLRISKYGEEKTSDAMLFRFAFLDLLRRNISFSDLDDLRRNVVNESEKDLDQLQFMIDFESYDNQNKAEWRGRFGDDNDEEETFIRDVMDKERVIVYEGYSDMWDYHLQILVDAMDDLRIMSESTRRETVTLEEDYKKVDKIISEIVGITTEQLNDDDFQLTMKTMEDAKVEYLNAQIEALKGKEPPDGRTFIPVTKIIDPSDWWGVDTNGLLQKVNTPLLKVITPLLKKIKAYLDLNMEEEEYEYILAVKRLENTFAKLRKGQGFWKGKEEKFINENIPKVLNALNEKKSDEITKIIKDLHSKLPKSDRPKALQAFKAFLEAIIPLPELIDGVNKREPKDRCTIIRVMRNILPLYKYTRDAQRKLAIYKKGSKKLAKIKKIKKKVRDNNNYFKNNEVDAWNRLIDNLMDRTSLRQDIEKISKDKWISGKLEESSTQLLDESKESYKELLEETWNMALQEKLSNVDIYTAANDLFDEKKIRTVEMKIDKINEYIKENSLQLEEKEIDVILCYNSVLPVFQTDSDISAMDIQWEPYEGLHKMNHSILDIFGTVGKGGGTAKPQLLRDIYGELGGGMLEDGTEKVDFRDILDTIHTNYQLDAEWDVDATARRRAFTKHINHVLDSPINDPANRDWNEFYGDLNDKETERTKRRMKVLKEWFHLDRLRRKRSEMELTETTKERVKASEQSRGALKVDIEEYKKYQFDNDKKEDASWRQTNAMTIRNDNARKTWEKGKPNSVEAMKWADSNMTHDEALVFAVSPFKSVNVEKPPPMYIYNEFSRTKDSYRIIFDTFDVGYPGLKSEKNSQECWDSSIGDLATILYYKYGCAPLAKNKKGVDTIRDITNDLIPVFIPENAANGNAPLSLDDAQSREMASLIVKTGHGSSFNEWLKDVRRANGQTGSLKGKKKKKAFSEGRPGSQLVTDLSKYISENVWNQEEENLIYKYGGEDVIDEEDLIQRLEYLRKNDAELAESNKNDVISTADKYITEIHKKYAAAATKNKGKEKSLPNRLDPNIRRRIRNIWIGQDEERAQSVLSNGVVDIVFILTDKKGDTSGVHYIKDAREMYLILSAKNILSKTDMEYYPGVSKDLGKKRCQIDDVDVGLSVHEYTSKNYPKLDVKFTTSLKARAPRPVRTLGKMIRVGPLGKRTLGNQRTDKYKQLYLEEDWYDPLFPVEGGVDRRYTGVVKKTNGGKSRPPVEEWMIEDWKKRFQYLNELWEGKTSNLMNCDNTTCSDKTENAWADYFPQDERDLVERNRIAKNLKKVAYRSQRFNVAPLPDGLSKPPKIAKLYHDDRIEMDKLWRYNANGRGLNYQLWNNQNNILSDFGIDSVSEFMLWNDIHFDGSPTDFRPKYEETYLIQGILHRRGWTDLQKILAFEQYKYVIREYQKVLSDQKMTVLGTNGDLDFMRYLIQILLSNEYVPTTTKRVNGFTMVGDIADSRDMIKLPRKYRGRWRSNNAVVNMLQCVITGATPLAQEVCENKANSVPTELGEINSTRLIGERMTFHLMWKENWREIVKKYAISQGVYNMDILYKEVSQSVESPVFEQKTIQFDRIVFSGGGKSVKRCPPE